MMGSTDQAFAALIEDMHERGLLAETLVCFVTEFGRTPRINERKGRDHWTHAFSFAFAGAGVPGGQVVGATDREGGYITSSKAYTIEDYAATIYEKLGIDRTQPIHTPAGRPIHRRQGRQADPRTVLNDPGGSPRTAECRRPVCVSHTTRFAKSVICDVLRPFSRSTEPQKEVVGELQAIDVCIIPNLDQVADRSPLGLLGELTTDLCLVEPYRNTPNVEEFRICIRKQYNWYRYLQLHPSQVLGETAQGDAAQLVPFPQLVIISPGKPEGGLEGYACRNNQSGVYSAVATASALTVVVVSELPRTRETLLLRMLGKDPVQLEAFADYRALPEDSWEKRVVTPVLICLPMTLTNLDGLEEDEMAVDFQRLFARLIDKKSRRRKPLNAT